MHLRLRYGCAFCLLLFAGMGAAESRIEFIGVIQNRLPGDPERLNEATFSACWQFRDQPPVDYQFDLDAAQTRTTFRAYQSSVRITDRPLSADTLLLYSARYPGYCTLYDAWSVFTNDPDVIRCTTSVSDGAKSYSVLISLIYHGEYFDGAGDLLKSPDDLVNISHFGLASGIVTVGGTDGSTYRVTINKATLNAACDYQDDSQPADHQQSMRSIMDIIFPLILDK